MSAPATAGDTDLSHVGAHTATEPADDDEPGGQVQPVGDEAQNPGPPRSVAGRHEAEDQLPTSETDDASDSSGTAAESRPAQAWEQAFGVATQVPLPVDGGGSASEPEPDPTEEATGEVQVQGPRDRVARLEFLAASPTLQPYRSWDTSHPLPEPSEASARERRDALMKIVEAEGPILGKRLYQLYVKSSGRSRAGSAIRRKLNQATYALEREDKLLGDDPLGETGQLPKTFRTPDQPIFILRELGDRRLQEVPPMELAAMIYTFQRPGEGAESTYRRVLSAYGLTMLTAATRTRLDECSALIWDDGS